MPRPQDHYAKKAKAMGYPARSVFKLKEIVERFHIIPPSPTILDIGAAPGSFSLFLLEKVGSTGRIIGVDLVPHLKIPSFPNYTYISGDIFSNDIRQKLLDFGPYDLIISDAAPATCGQKEVDALKSIALAECVLQIASTSLKANGKMVVKIFQGSGEQEFLLLLRQTFKQVRGFKPKASRSESFETYFICSELKSKELPN